MEQAIEKLLTQRRSLTGEGVDESFETLKTACDFDILQVPSGKRIFDWVVPDVWEVKGAYIKGIVDWADNPLHLMGYSRPFRGRLTGRELLPHIYTHETAIPYKTTYYGDKWGFCMNEATKAKISPEKSYEVVVDTKLTKGVLKYGMRTHKGTSGKKYLFSTYSCHPLMANDNVSGMVVWALLNRWVSDRSTRHTYEFLIAPETIGALTYLHEQKPTLDGAFVLTCLGGDDKFSRKYSFANGYIDRVVDKAFYDLGIDPINYPFDVRGSDERQFSSHPFRIPTTSIHRGKYYEYPQYHTSADNKLNMTALVESFTVYTQIIKALEADTAYHSTISGEAMMGPRGLYDTPFAETFLWTMFHSGKTVFETACETMYSVEEIEKAVSILERQGLCRRE